MNSNNDSRDPLGARRASGRPAAGAAKQARRTKLRQSSAAKDKPVQPEVRGRYYIEALGRGLSLLESFVQPPYRHTLRDLSERIGVNRGTTFRLLRTLEEAGFVIQDAATKQFRLSLRLLDLQQASLAALEYPKVAEPFLQDLSARLSESSSMAVLEGTQVRYVARVAAKRIMSVNLHVGSALPAHATSLGKVLLAALDPEVVKSLYASHPMESYTARTITSLDRLQKELRDVQRQGYAIADQSLELGLRSASAPVRNARGQVVAAINVSVSSARITRDQLVSRMVPSVLETAGAISVQLGYAMARTS